jgi:hypothetical protein
MMFAFLPASLAIFFQFSLVDLAQTGLDYAEFDHTS